MNNLGVFTPYLGLIVFLEYSGRSDGEKKKEKEEDRTNLTKHYGLMKLRGEEFVR